MSLQIPDPLLDETVPCPHCPAHIICEKINRCIYPLEEGDILSKNGHYKPHYSEGERCHLCGKPASHKVYESISAPRHALTTYLCCDDFSALMGGVAKKMCDGQHD